jgi:tRNA dimethylallyltransferase
VLGPTAAGKTDVAVAIAGQLGGEILSVDSMQVYRGLNIGTAKVDAATAARVPHHLIDLAEPHESFSVAQFQHAGRTRIAELEARSTIPIIAGGSGLHFRALMDPLDFPPTDAALRTELEATDPAALIGELLLADPDADRRVDLANPRRVLRAVEILRLTGATPSQRAETEHAQAVRSYEPLIGFRAIGLDPGERLAARVIARFDAMLTDGLLGEVEDLADQLGPTARQAVGYKELLGVVGGEYDLEEGRNRAIQATLALAKRQRTFFRRDPRIRWLPWHDDAEQRVSAAFAAIEDAVWNS